jgi:Raf kinase inhibitor-like YbhB/YbcL family protein
VTNFMGKSRRATSGLVALAMAVVLGTVGCSSSGAATASSATGSSAPQVSAASQAPRATLDASGFKLTSTAYADGGNIPEKYTCLGDSVSPPLAWVGAPAGTAAYALVMFDETALYTHWIAELTSSAAGGSLDEDATRSNTGLTQSVRYVAPCPPSGGTNHHYVITLYALSAPITLTALSPSDAETAMDGKVLASTTLAGWYAIQ